MTYLGGSAIGGNCPGSKFRGASNFGRVFYKQFWPRRKKSPKKYANGVPPIGFFLTPASWNTRWRRATATSADRWSRERFTENRWSPIVDGDDDDLSEFSRYRPSDIVVECDIVCANGDVDFPAGILITIYNIYVYIFAHTYLSVCVCAYIYNFMYVGSRTSLLKKEKKIKLCSVVFRIFFRSTVFLPIVASQTSDNSVNKIV